MTQMITNKTNITLINGGQTGVDRAILDFAVKYDIPYTGYICDAEDMTAKELIKKYPNLIDIGLTNIERTKKNIEMADWLVSINDPKTVNTDSRTFAKKWVMFDTHSPTVLSEIFKWYKQLDDITKLCIGGPRESWERGIYEETTNILEEVFYVLTQD